MKTILKLKHWMLFILFIILCLPMPRIPQIFLYSIILGIILFWEYSIVIIGQEKLSKGGITIVNLKSIKIIFFFGLVVMPTSLLIEFFEENTMGLPGFLTTLGILIGLFWFVAWIYISYCAAIIISSLQANKKTTNWLGNFRLLLIFPIGIWAIQPKLNRLLS